ncbi:MAG: hypothetical protein ACHRXM_18240 [Isosphaerales bacterium]
MATEGEKIPGLHDFFVESFTASELHMFLARNGYREIASAANQSVGGTQYFFDVEEALNRRGLIDDTFFVRLRRERPAKEALIRGLQEAWLVEENLKKRQRVETNPDLVQFELTIDRDFAQFTQQEQDKLLKAIGELLGIGGTIQVLSKIRGSVRIVIELPRSLAAVLARAINDGRLVEFGVTDAAVIPPPGVNRATVAAIGGLAGPGEDVRNSIPGSADPLPGSLRLDVDPKRSDIADGSPTSENDFDPRATEVAKAIRSKLDAIKDGKVRDENGQEVWLLTLISRELGAGGPSSGKDLSEYLATFLTERRDVEHVGLLVARVFGLLCNRGKKAEAQIIGDVVDLMLPLCLPRDILSEAWAQLQNHGAVLIQSSVARKTGAEILVAGLFKKPTRWGISSPEPTGEQLVEFEDVPIGDPDQNEESALRDLYVATLHPDDKKKGTSVVMRLTAAQMRDDLGGRYKWRKLKHQRPPYCALELAASEADRQNQEKLISKLAIPDLLFIGLKPDSKTRELESFVIACLNTRLEWVARGFPE